MGGSCRKSSFERLFFRCWLKRQTLPIPGLRLGTKHIANKARARTARETDAAQQSGLGELEWNSVVTSPKGSLSNDGCVVLYLFKYRTTLHGNVRTVGV